jgi:hypothetical protein
MTAVDFSMKPLRVIRHTICLFRHPAGAPFFLTGLRRNLREWQNQRTERRLIPEGINEAASQATNFLP